MKRTPRAVPPKLIERVLAGELRSLLSTVPGIARRLIVPIIPQIAGGTIGYDHAIADAITRLGGILARAIPPSTVSRIVEPMLLRLANHQSAQLYRQIHAVTGSAPPPSAERWLPEMIADRARTIVKRFQLVIDRYIGRLDEALRRGVRDRASADDLEESIRARFFAGQIQDHYRDASDEMDALESGSDSIVLDEQYGLYSQITQARHEELGITRYVWRTQRDDRVRPAHAAREGQIFDWGSPPEGGAPGDDYNCRCEAEPMLEDLAPAIEEPNRPSVPGDLRLGPRPPILPELSIAEPARPDLPPRPRGPVAIPFEGAEIKMDLSPAQRRSKRVGVVVDVSKIDASWAAEDRGLYIPPGGGGAEIAGRRAGVREFLKRGEALHAPDIAIAPSSGEVAFVDGRHRFTVLRDAGTPEILVSVHSTEAAAIESRFGIKPRRRSS